LNEVLICEVLIYYLLNEVLICVVILIEGLCVFVVI